MAGPMERRALAQRLASTILATNESRHSRGDLMTDGSKAFAMFMASTAGRLLRIVVGVALIAWGWTMRETTAGIVLMVVGLAPVLAGVFNVCLIAPLIGAPFSGKDVLRAPGAAGPKP